MDKRGGGIGMLGKGLPVLGHRLDADVAVAEFESDIIIMRFEDVFGGTNAVAGVDVDVNKIKRVHRRCTIVKLLLRLALASSVTASSRASRYLDNFVVRTCGVCEFT